MLDFLASALIFTERLCPERQQQIRVDHILHECKIYCDTSIGNKPLLSEHIAALLEGKARLEHSLHFPDTAENRSILIAEIAHLYGFFLTEAAHESERRDKLRSQGMWLDKTAQDFPEQERLRLRP